MLRYVQNIQEYIMGTEMNPQGIGPVLLEEGVINICFRFAYFLLPLGFCHGPCSHLVQLVRGAGQGHSCW